MESCYTSSFSVPGRQFVVEDYFLEDILKLYVQESKEMCLLSIMQKKKMHTVISCDFIY